MQTVALDPTSLARPPYYHPFSRMLRGRFGESVYKVTLDTGFSCPNIDGSKATGGCTFCDNTSFSPALRAGDSRISDQLERGKAFYRERFGASKFLAYFQTFTNTYAPVEQLRRLYDEALAHPDIVGMCIGTRPDCIDAEKLRLLQGYIDAKPKRFISIEYGMQTMHDTTAEAINRAHDHAATIEAVNLTREHAPDVHLCLHLIAGLPGESPEMIRQSIDECARLRPDSVKFHHCYVFDNTVLADQYRAGEYTPMDLETHVGLAADCIERMPPATAIQRLVGEINDPGVLAPQWGKSKLQVIQMIVNELQRRGTHQGIGVPGSEF